MGETSNASASKKGVLDVVIRMLGALCTSKPELSHAAQGQAAPAGEPNLPIQLPGGPKPGHPIALSEDIGILV